MNGTRRLAGPRAHKPVSLALIAGQRLDIGIPLAYARTNAVLAEAGQKRRKIV